VSDQWSQSEHQTVVGEVGGSSLGGQALEVAPSHVPQNLTAAELELK